MQAHGHPSGFHSVQFYTDHSFLLDGLARWIGSAVAAGDAIVIIATASHREWLRERLAEHTIDLSLLSERGRYLEVDAAEALSEFMVDGLPDEAKFDHLIGQFMGRVRTAAGDAGRVVAFGEMVALLWEQGNPEAAIQLERMWNRFIGKHSIALHCAYPLGGFDRESHSDAFLRICSEHSCIVPDESYSALKTEEERARRISYLQQRAQALEAEIAERKQIEKVLQSREAELMDFVDNSVEGLQRVGPDQKILWANQYLLRLLGYEFEEYVGRSLKDIHADAAIFENFWERLLKREDIRDFPVLLKCKDGTIKHIILNSNGRWSGDRFLYTRCFIRDVTEQRLAEDALRRVEKLAAAGRLAATIAHEINNPLEAVTNLLYLARSEETALADARSYLAMADSEVRRLSHVAKQTLGFYRESTIPSRFDLNRAIRDVLMIYSGRLASKRIEVVDELGKECSISGMRGEIIQLFSNLIANAIDAMPNGGRLRVRCRPGDFVTISVQDTGTGISETDIKKIFEPFYTTKEDVGTGLGLWVAQEVAKRHGGGISVQSSAFPAQPGTTFTVKLAAHLLEQSAA